jgi:hypothetical protein
MTPAEVLEKAADLLETIGWVQGDEIVYGSSDPDAGPVITGMCARGACRIAAGAKNFYDTWTSAEQYEAFRDARRALEAGLGGEWRCIPVWNDEPGRTAEEVIDKMKQVAKDLRNEEAPQVL